MKYCLVVDDSRAIRAVARRILEELHFEAAEAEDGMSALRSCREKMPDLILLDGTLPNMSSVDFLKSVRGQPGGDRPAILLCTTENDASELSQAMAAGANACLMKPFDRGIVETKLAEMGVLAA